MFFKRKCGCGSRDPVVYTNTFATMAGDVSLHYCQRCYDEKEAFEDARRVEWDREAEIQRAEQRKQRYYENLKREVELQELTEKAKLLGIKTEGISGDRKAWEN